MRFAVLFILYASMHYLFYLLFRFRHAVVSAMTGHKTKRHGSAGKTRMADVVSAVQGIQDVTKKGLMPSCKYTI